MCDILKVVQWEPGLAMWSGHALGGSLPQNFGKLGIRSLATVLTTCLPKFLSALCTIFLWIGGSQESKSSSYVHECWLSVLVMWHGQLYSLFWLLNCMLWKSLDFRGESRQSPGRPIPWHPSHQATADSLHAYRGIGGTDRWHQTLQESASIPWITTLQSNSCSPVLSTGYTPPWTRAFPPVNDSLQVISAFRTWRFPPQLKLYFHITGSCVSANSHVINLWPLELVLFVFTP